MLITWPTPCTGSESPIDLVEPVLRPGLPNSRRIISAVQGHHRHLHPCGHAPKRFPERGVGGGRARVKILGALWGTIAT